MTFSKDIRHQIHLAGLWKKVFCLLLLSDKRHIKKQNQTDKQKKTRKAKHKDPMYFFFLQRTFFFYSCHHVTNSFKHWLSISLQKESSDDVNVERCKRCVSSSRFGLEQKVDPVSDCVRNASHGRRQARWRRRNEVVHKRTDGEDNRVANGALSRLNRGQGQCTVLAIWFIDAEVVFILFFIFFFFFFLLVFGREKLFDWFVCLNFQTTWKLFPDE